MEGSGSYTLMGGGYCAPAHYASGASSSDMSSSLSIATLPSSSPMAAYKSASLNWFRALRCLRMRDFWCSATGREMAYKSAAGLGASSGS